MSAHVLLRQLNEVHAGAIAHTARARVQHEPYIVGFIEADFDEMVPGPQRAELVCRVRVAVQLRMLVEHSLVAVAKHPPRYRVSPGCVAKRPLVSATAVMRASVGHGLFDGRANRRQVVGKVRSRQCRVHRCHSTADVDTDGSRNDGFARRDDTSHGGPKPPVHVRHGRQPPVNERKLGGA